MKTRLASKAGAKLNRLTALETIRLFVVAEIVERATGIEPV